MPDVAPCPDDEVLRAALSRGVPDALLVHLASCDGCRSRMSAMEADDRFLARARAALADDADGVLSAVDLVPGYVIRRSIAQGGQGTVHEAFEEGTGRRVAIKLLGRRARITTKERLRFEREAQLASRLHHPNIASVIASGTARDGRPYIVMEYVEGVPLDEHSIHRAARSSLGRDPAILRAAVELLRTIAEAMALAHGRGVIHRDLKPSNVLVDAEGRPHIIDFGLARLLEPGLGGATMTGEFVGSVAYAAPEQLAGEREVDARADVHALGVIGYELLLGEGPYQPESSIGRTVKARLSTEPRTPRRIDPLVPRDLDAILRTAVARDPDRRYPSAEAMARDLRLHLEGRPIEVRRDSTWYVMRRTIRRHRLSLGIALMVLLVAISVAVAMTVSWRRAADAETLASTRAEALDRAVLTGELEQARLALMAGDGTRAESLAWGVVSACMEQGRMDADEASSLLEQANWVLRSAYERSPSMHAAQVGRALRPGVLAWSADGRTVRIVSHPDDEWAWEIERGALRSRDRQVGRPIACRGDADHVAEVTAEGILLSLDGGRTRGVPLPDGDDPVERVATNRAGDVVLACRASGTIDVVDGDGTVRASMSRPVGARIAVSASGRWGAISDADRRIAIWDLAALRRIGAVGSDRTGNVRFSPDESLVAIAEGGEVVLYRVGGLGRVRSLGGLHGWLVDIGFDSTGKRLVGAGWDREVATWRVADGELLSRYTGHTDDIWGVAISPDDRFVATVDRGGEVRVWSAHPVDVPERAAFSRQSVLDAARVPATDLIVCGLESGEVVLVELDGLHERRRWLAHEGIVGAVAAVPDGTAVVSAGYDGRVARFELDGSPRWSTAVGGYLSDVAVDPQGALVAAALDDGRVMLLDASDGHPIADLARHRRRVATVAFSPDGRMLASAGVDGEIVIGAPRGPSWRTLARVDEGVARCATFDPTGRRLAFGGDDRTVHVVDLETGREESRLTGHRGSIFALAFDSTGDRIASLDSYGLMQLAIDRPWTIVQAARVHETMGFAILFAPDDETIVTVSRDGTVARRALDAAEPCIAGMRSRWLGGSAPADGR